MTEPDQTSPRGGWTALENILNVIVDASLASIHSNMPGYSVSVDYCAVFAQSDDEYLTLDAAAMSRAVAHSETPTGRMYDFDLIVTRAGSLRKVKVRRPDGRRRERGDADFVVSDFASAVARFGTKRGFDVIQGKRSQMLSLTDPETGARSFLTARE